MRGINGVATEVAPTGWLGVALMVMDGSIGEESVQGLVGATLVAKRAPRGWFRVAVMVMDGSIGEESVQGLVGATSVAKQAIL